MASSIRRNFSCKPGQINFDGKLMVDLFGFGKVNRLAIVLVQKESNKILAIAKTESSTGKVEAEAVKKALDEWEITEKIIACGFDTTSSNTGVHKGACKLLQELLSRQILWLACRHHILELVVGAAFFELFGDTTSPEVTLFKVLKKSWDTLDLDDLQLPDVPTLYRGDTEELLAWIETLLEPENVESLPRCDYKEFLELHREKEGVHLPLDKTWSGPPRTLDEQIDIYPEDGPPHAPTPGTSLANQEEDTNDVSLCGLRLHPGLVLRPLSRYGSF